MYRNQSNDLKSKSRDWFLYDGDFGHGRFKTDVMQIFSVLYFLILNLFQPSVTFYIETSQLLGFCILNALLHLYIQSKYGKLKKRKPLCLNMFYTIISGAKRKHQNKGLCLVFFLILSKYRVLLVNGIIHMHLFQTEKSKP